MSIEYNVQKIASVTELQSRLDVLKEEWSQLEWRDATDSKSPFMVLEEQVKRVIRECGFDFGHVDKRVHETDLGDESTSVRMWYCIPRVLVIIQYRTSDIRYPGDIIEHCESLGILKAVELQ
jgi:hypothetical protein